MSVVTSSSLPRPANVVRSIPQALASDQPSISFEFFPPKNDEAETQLWETIRRLEKTRPTFVSVTYGAGGTTRDRTVRVTERIARETTLTPLAHLTCVGHSVSELRSVIGSFSDAGIRNLLALRGDPLGGPDAEWQRHAEGLDHAEELVELVRSLGAFTVGVAAFPDQHPESADLDADADVLVRKADAGAEYAITQFFFTTAAYLALRERVAARGRDLPIIPGLMPVTNVKQLARMTQLSGQPVPPSVTSRLEALRRCARSASRSPPSSPSSCSPKEPRASTSLR